MNGTEPGFQETGPEGKNQAGLRKVIPQGRVHALHEPMGEGWTLGSQAAHADVVWSPVCLGKALPERIAVASVLAPKDGHRVGEARIAKRNQALYYQAQGLVPPDGTQLAAPRIPNHGSLQAVGVVPELEPAKGLGAERPAVNGMKGIPGNAGRLTVERPDQDPTPSRALLTDGRNHDLFRCGPLLEVLACLFRLGQATSGQGSGPGGSAHHLEESSPRDSHRSLYR